MTALVPGLHLLDPETYAVAGAGRVFNRLRELDRAERTRDEALSTIPAQRTARHARPATP